MKPFLRRLVLGGGFAVALGLPLMTASPAQAWWHAGPVWRPGWTWHGGWGRGWRGGVWVGGPAVAVGVPAVPVPYAYPYPYAYPPAAYRWIPPHYAPNGVWIPGHWGY